FVGAIMAALFFAAYTVERLLMGPDRAFAGASEELAKISGYTGVYVRQAFYRWTIAHVGVDAYIGFMTLLSKRQARIGDRAYIGRMCTIGWAEIGDDVMIADGVQVLSGRHTHGSAAQEG